MVSETVPVVVPSAGTLKLYGFGFGPGALAPDPVEDWQALLASQGGVCPICEKVPKTGRFVTDHDHVRGWKKMPPELKRLYVRGITCWFCNNTYLGRALTMLKARNVVAYLEAYLARKP